MGRVAKGIRHPSLGPFYPSGETCRPGGVSTSSPPRPSVGSYPPTKVERCCLYPREDRSTSYTLSFARGTPHALSVYHAPTGGWHGRRRPKCHSLRDDRGRLGRGSRKVSRVTHVFGVTTPSRSLSRHWLFVDERDKVPTSRKLVVVQVDHSPVLVYTSGVGGSPLGCETETVGVEWGHCTLHLY